MKKTDFMAKIYALDIVDRETGELQRYIGKTTYRHPENRRREHEAAALKNKGSERKLQQAIRNAAQILQSTLETCKAEDASTRERARIAQEDTYRNGLNSTEGGEGQERARPLDVIEYGPDGQETDRQTAENIRHAVQILQENLLETYRGASGERYLEQNIRQILDKEHRRSFRGPEGRRYTVAEPPHPEEPELEEIFAN